MDAQLLTFLKRHGLWTGAKLAAAHPEQRLYGEVLDEGSFEVILSKAARVFGILPPEHFVERVRAEYAGSWKPSVRHFAARPERAPLGFNEEMTLGDLEDAVSRRSWAERDVYVIPARDWLL